MTNYKILTEVEINEALQGLSDWSVKDGELTATFKLSSYSEAIAFITQVGTLAEKYDHHPPFSNAYDTVSFSFCTHDVGNKVTDVDIKVAEEISKLVRK